MNFEPTRLHTRCEELSARGYGQATIARFLGITAQDVWRLMSDMQSGDVADLAGGKRNKVDRSIPITERITTFLEMQDEPVMAKQIADGIGEERQVVSCYLREMRRKGLVNRVTPSGKKPGFFTAVDDD